MGNRHALVTAPDEAAEVKEWTLMYQPAVNIYEDHDLKSLVKTKGWVALP